ncbi:hypothetical protein GCM10010191_57500 [Actinomadura vinacea]|uniref:Uncharacterized protein n=1 Tax=Actinomadura vinacea TaxID=115336 RepID=A0ABP5WSQ8_9ACTN
MPFISQPGISTVSPAPSATSRSASVRKCWSKAPDAPSRSSPATTGSGIPGSFGASIGTFTTSIRFRPPRRHCVHGRSTSAGPSTPCQVPPGR